MRQTRQRSRTGINAGRLCLSILLSVAMVASTLLPGGSTAFAKELNDQNIELVELSEPDGASNDQGSEVEQGELQQDEPVDELLTLEEDEAIETVDGDEAADLIDVDVADEEDMQVQIQDNGQQPSASVTADGTTTPYVSFANAVEAWKTADGATLTLLADVSDAYVPIVSGTRTIDLNGYGLTGESVANNYTIEDLCEDGAQLTIIDGRPGAEHRYANREGYNDPAVVDDTLTTGYKTFTGGYITSLVEDGILVDGATVCLQGINIIGCECDAIDSYGGNLTIKSCDIIGCGSDGVYAPAGVIAMTDCHITDCGDEGFDAEGCVATLTNCTISDCSDEGVEVDESAVTMEGCTITGCSERGIYLYDVDAHVTLVDTTITGNTAPIDDENGDTYVGAGVYVEEGTLSLCGDVEIYNNTIGGKPSNLYVKAAYPVQIAGELKNTTPIGVQTEGAYTFTSGLANNGSLANFTSEMPEEFGLSLTSEGDARFLFKDGSMIIPARGNDVLDLRNKAVGYSVHVYDAGGKNGDYGDRWDGTLTVLHPADKAVRVHGTVNTESGYDYLYVYADYGTSGVRQLEKIDGYGQTVDQTVADDPMLLRFYSDRFTTYAGLDLVVEVVELPDDHASLNKHVIVCAETPTGAVTADRQSSYANKVITLTLNPDDGYVPKNLEVRTDAGNEVLVREEVEPSRLTYTFLMPDNNVTATAEFAKAARVTFANADGTTISSRLVVRGTAATAPQAQVRQGTAFVGWQKDGHMFDISTPIEEDTTLTAVCVEGSGLMENFDRTRHTLKNWTNIQNPSPDDGNDYVYMAERGHTRPGCAYLDVYNNEEVFLITPAQDLSDAREGASLGFWYRSHTWAGNGEEFGAYYRVGEDGAWNPLFEADLSRKNTGEWSSWHQVSLLLPSEALVQDVQIGFRAYAAARSDNSYPDCQICVDDVSILKLGHCWGYAVKDGAANVLVATCANGADVCAVDGATATLSLEAEDAVYTGSAVKATVTKDSAWIPANGLDATMGTVTYFQGGRQLKGAPTQVGSYTAKVTVHANDKDFTLCKAFSITPKTVGLTWSNTKLTYNGKKQAPSATATGLVSGDTCTVTVGGAAKNAGSHTATATGLSNSNYALPKNVTASYTIAKAKLTVTAKNKKIKFGAKAANAGVTYKGFVGTDTAKSLGGKLKYSYGKYKKGSKVGTYKITPSGLSSKNYAITYKKGTLTVKAPSTVAISTKVRVKSKGWVGINSKAMSGTTGKSLRATAFRSALQNAPYGGSIKYRAHWQIEGWQKSWTKGGKTCAPVQVGRRMEAIEIRLTSDMAKHYDVWYRVHVQSIGWMAWVKNGARAGTTGQGRRMEAVQLVILPKGSKAPTKNYKGIKQDYRKAFVAK